MMLLYDVRCSYKVMHRTHVRKLPLSLEPHLSNRVKLGQEGNSPILSNSCDWEHIYIAWIQI